MWAVSVRREENGFIVLRMLPLLYFWLRYPNMIKFYLNLIMRWVFSISKYIFEVCSHLPSIGMHKYMHIKLRYRQHSQNIYLLELNVISQSPKLIHTFISNLDYIYTKIRRLFKYRQDRNKFLQLVLTWMWKSWWKMRTQWI